MKSILVIFVVLMGANAMAKQKWPSKMPNWCAKKLVKSEEIRDGSEQADAAAIVADLKFDWKKNPSSATATYSDCGSSDYFYVTVDKATCKVVESDQGDSDGECE